VFAACFVPGSIIRLTGCERIRHSGRRIGNGNGRASKGDNEPRKTKIDRSVFILKGLNPGSYLISARGSSNNAAVQDSLIVVVESNKATPANLNMK
jgi:hypothetical protein